MVIGEYIKQQRLSLKLSRKAFAKNIINDDYLADIENNKNELRADTFIKLMNANNLSLDKFLQNFDTLQVQSYAVQIKADKAFANHDTKTLEKMVKESSYPRSVTIQVIKLMINKLRGEKDPLPKNSKSIIKKFLFENENWNENSLWVIANSWEIYKVEEANEIMNWLLNNEQNFDKYTEYKIKLLAQVCINYFYLYKETKQAQQELQKIYSYMDRLPNCASIFSEKAYFKYLKSTQKGNWNNTGIISEYIKIS